jgi:hypothetical protein
MRHVRRQDRPAIEGEGRLCVDFVDANSRGLPVNGTPALNKLFVALQHTGVLLRIMRTSILLHAYANGRLIGPRLSATPIREAIKISLAQGEEVVLDFSGVEATQSFIDGLVGVLILQRGPDVLNHLVFKSCSDDVKAVLQFVADDRCDQYIKAQQLRKQFSSYSSRYKS